MVEKPVKDDGVGPAEIRAGRDYLHALQRLGLEPQVMCWMYEMLDDRFEKRLGIVTSWVDRMGPALLYELLFKAYDAAATPRDIDPFIVQLYSPDSHAGAALYRAAVKNVAPPGLEDSIEYDVIEGIYMVHTNGVPVGNGLYLARGGTYVARRRDISAEDDRRRGQRFRRRVEALVA
ncbi:hypothetical protein N6H05_20895 [Sphingobium sp. WTD-1]|uniref:hypothetical protein n=1 Tax=Sphingobium sp. WTD-1 TaxID=2979467 RepID=UPI0024DEED53|nr:hypothetical protein [Sphingobium sp. WTD-1]WIA55460.1 hypothetical protein N6H05_20895 [Sphingobium sp. WTD-1]